MKTTTTTKVHRTQEVNTSYGLKNCCKGKLILLPTDKPLEAGLLAQSKSIPEKFTILNHATVEAFKNEPTCGWQVIDPIIISETEEIKSTFDNPTWVYDCRKDMNGFIHEITCSLENSEPVYKILALPKNISPKQLQVIVDGRLKYNSEVLVGCIKVTDDEYKYTNDELYQNKHISFFVENDLKGYITLHKAVDETWDDIYKRINTVEFNSKIEVFNYLKKHYHSPKRLS